MGQSPSDEALKEELGRLSTYLYDCIDQGGSLGPHRWQYDKLRDKRLCNSESLLKAYGLPVNRDGWEQLLNAFSLGAPTHSDAKRANYARPKPPSGKPLVFVDHEAEYMALKGTAREVIYHSVDKEGNTIKITRTIISLR